MARYWRRAGLALVGMVCGAACATGVVDRSSGTSEGAGGSAGQGGITGMGGDAGHAGAGGQGGQAGMGGQGGQAGAGGQGGQGGQGGGPSLCGNGMKDPGELCDGADFGGKTCASIGLGSGDLICNPYCGIVASNCVPKENCLDFQDNDQDGLVDCLDDDCAMEASCLDACAAPKTITIPGYFSGDTTARPSSEAASCSPQSSSEVIFYITAPQDGTLMISVDSWAGVDFSLSLRTACKDPASEVACSNIGDPNSGKAEILTREVLAGESFFLVLDGAAGTDGPFDLSLDMPQPESFCSDFFDDDSDGYLDCDDATACQDSFECVPGPTPVGDPCFSPSDCAANQNDPVCLQDFQGFPGGYCSEWCDVATQDCPMGAVCGDVGIGSVHGVCLDSCVMDSECRDGYACVDKGFSTKVCMLGPEAACDNYSDDDFDQLTDCEDPDCQPTPACASGSKVSGVGCDASNECYSAENDPLCLSEVQYGYPGGYCSEYCYFANDCGPGGVCSSWFSFPSGAGTCMRACTMDSQCRPGYFCADIGMPKKICIY